MSKITTETEIDISDQLMPITKDLTLLFERVYTLQQGVTEILVNTPPALAAPIRKPLYTVYLVSQYAGQPTDAELTELGFDMTLVSDDRYMFPSAYTTPQGINPPPTTPPDMPTMDRQRNLWTDREKKIIVNDWEAASWNFSQPATVDGAWQYIRQEAARGFRTGIYGNVPVSQNAMNLCLARARGIVNGNEWVQWMDANSREAKLISTLDMLNPSLYIPASKDTTTGNWNVWLFNDWRAATIQLFRECRRIAEHLPIVPFISPENAGLPDAAAGMCDCIDWQIETFAEQGITKFVIWSGSRAVWNPDAPWLAAVKGLVGV